MAAGLPFLKMHGLGNDFVVVDLRRHPFAVTAAVARRIADRREGVGCDQMITIEPPRDAEADAFMGIRNADGSTVAACGNASRCVAHLLMAERRRDSVVIETAAGLLRAAAAGAAAVTVDMGPARLDWRDIPLARAVEDTAHLPLSVGPLADGVGVSMGNPHAVFFVADAEAVPLEDVGPRLEHHPLFPERTNVEAVGLLPGGALRMRVWERGTGITRACGTGACAALVAAVLRGHVERSAEVVLDGGSLHIDWDRAANRVLMTGPVATSFSGVLDESLLRP
jgi:diaminopimelate epimerase